MPLIGRSEVEMRRARARNVRAVLCAANHFAKARKRAERIEREPGVREVCAAVVAAAEAVLGAARVHEAVANARWGFGSVDRAALYGAIDRICGHYASGKERSMAMGASSHHVSYECTARCARLCGHDPRFAETVDRIEAGARKRLGMGGGREGTGHQASGISGEGEVG